MGGVACKNNHSYRAEKVDVLKHVSVDFCVKISLIGLIGDRIEGY